MVAVALVVFPKLTLGLSGFETGVAVMPLVRGDPTTHPPAPTGRIRNTRKLLTTAALIMSGFLITSSFATTVLIPHGEFEEGGQATGCALAYLAQEYLGNGLGTAYDLSTIGILWLAVPRPWPVADPSEFEARLQVTGEERHGYRILRMESSAVPNAIAAVLLHIRDLTGKRPHVFFDWTEGNPVAPAALPDLRQRRGRTGHPRGPPRGRTRSPAAALRPRRLSARSAPAPRQSSAAWSVSLRLVGRATSSPPAERCR
jgi:hypothetical protein